MFDLNDADQVEVRRQDVIELLASLDAGSVAAIVTDPPYGISYQSNRSEVSGKKKPIAGDWNFSPSRFLDQCARVLREDGAVWVFTRWDVYPLWHAVVPTTLKVQNFIVWVKDNHTAGDLTGNLGYKWEGLMLLSRSDGRLRLRGARHSNVWECPRVPHNRMTHPTEKPVALLQKAIECFTDVGDLIVDPFCGSGSTGDAAILTGRRAILGDVDADHVCTAKRRLGLPCDGVDLEQKPEPTRTTQGWDMDLSFLDGIHPEDLASLVQRFKQR